MHNSDWKCKHREARNTMCIYKHSRHTSYNLRAKQFVTRHSFSVQYGKNVNLFNFRYHGQKRWYTTYIYMLLLFKKTGVFFKILTRYYYFDSRRKLQSSKRFVLKINNSWQNNIFLINIYEFHKFSRIPTLKKMFLHL